MVNRLLAGSFLISGGDHSESEKGPRVLVAGSLDGKPIEQVLPATLDVQRVSERDLSTEQFETAECDCLVLTDTLEETEPLAAVSDSNLLTCNFPIVLVATDGSETLASKAVAAGVDEYVPYRGPEDRERLRTAIERAVETHSRCVETQSLDGIEAAVEHAADAVLITDSHGTIEYVNPAFEELTGYSRSEAIGENPRILKSGEQGSEYYARMWEHILDGEVWEEVIVNQRKDGETYITHQTVAPVTDDSGEIQQFVGIQRNVTRQRQLEEQIERSATTLSRLYELTADQSTLAEKVDQALAVTARHLNYPVGYLAHIEDGTQEIIAATGEHELIQPGATDPIERTYCRKTITSDEPVTVSNAPDEGWENDPAFEHFGLRCYIGAKVTVGDELYGTLCFGGKKPREDLLLDAHVSTVQTLANWVGYELERSQQERQLEHQNDQLEQFASVVSHDLRSPLNVAQLSLDLAERTGDATQFERVADAHDRMESIIADTLTLASEGAVVEETEEVAVNRLARECWHTVETADATLSVEDSFHIDADPDRLKHIFENLFRNAVDHAGEGVTVAVEQIADGFAVADDGPGIPPEERSAVFDHGYSGDDGTGFGLSIVETVAQAHGWEVRIEDSEDGGARFVFETGGPTGNEVGLLLTNGAN